MQDSSFVKFPTTPYLFAPPHFTSHQDRVLTDEETKVFFSEKVIIEEKIDGANLGISFSPDGIIQLQNRGHIIIPPYEGQWRPLSKWLENRIDQLFDILLDKYILFGEWCYIKHSVHYISLPDWFIAFDLFDKQKHAFLPVKIRNQIIKRIGLAVVPQIYTGHLTKSLLGSLVNKSAFSEELCEGLYIRIDASDRLLYRAKYVRNSFSESIEAHWKKNMLTKNQLATYDSPITY